MKSDDVMAHVVNQLIIKMEAGAGTWTMPWTNAGLAPTNATTNIPYRGGNVIALWIAQLDGQYRHSLWATYRQWDQAHAQVRKGEKGTFLVKWNRVDRVQADGKVKEMMIPKGFTVFNADQVDGYTPPSVAEHRPVDEVIAAFFAAVPARYHPGAPAYMSTLDVVSMPPIENFVSVDHYHGTLAHELAHWTGHKSRLDRDLTGRFGDNAYALEELVAELSAAMTCGHLGLNTAARLDHAAYLQHWVRVLNDDPSILWRVAGHAQRATDHLITYSMEEPCPKPTATSLISATV